MSESMRACLRPPVMTSHAIIPPVMTGNVPRGTGQLSRAMGSSGKKGCEKEVTGTVGTIRGVSVSVGRRAMDILAPEGGDTGQPLRRHVALLHLQQGR